MGFKASVGAWLAREVVARRNTMVWIKSIQPDENPIIKELHD